MAIQDFKQMDGHIEHQVDRDILGNVIRHRTVYYDHLGNAFIKIGDMCDYYNIPYRIFIGRLNNKMPLKNALETPVRDFSSLDNLFKNQGVYRDFDGNSFESLNDLCSYHNVNAKSLLKSLNEGENLIRALNKNHRTPKKKSLRTNSETQAKKRVIKATHKTVKDIMGRESNKLVYLDHKGNEFSSIKKMCDAWGIHYTFVTKRLNKGNSLNIALEKKMTKSEIAECFKNKYYIDHIGHSFSSFQAMCNYWKKSSSFVKYRLEHGKSLQEALEEIINI